MLRRFITIHQRFVEPIKFFCMSSSSKKRKVQNIPNKISVCENKTVQLRKVTESCENPESAASNKISMDYSNHSDSVSRKVIYLDLPAKSDNDKKEYRVIQLLNGIKVLLISDHNTNKTKPGVLPLAKKDAEESDEEDEEEDEIEEEEGEEEEEEEESEMEDEDEDENENNKEKHGKKSGSNKSKEGERMAAASLCINVGSFSDPSDLPGLAHFLEHMVFMGSEKYTQENAFDEFLKMHGGSSNASTDCEYTTFEFEVHQSCFCEALNIFAHSLASPLLRPESMTREKKAIDSEFQMALPSDTCRKQQLFASFAKTGHPMSKFTWGNSDTLNLPNDPEGSELNKRLRIFWKQYYTADRMTLVLQSKHSLDQLEDWAKSVFHVILPSDNLVVPPRFDVLGSPYDTPNFNKIFQVIPVKDVNQVCLSWALPSQLDYYRSKPLGYLSWLVGHEGHGSLLAFLRKKVWALDLACGNDESGFEHNSTYALFSININLTEKGMEEVEQVIGTVFQYIDMLKKHGPDSRIWKEIQTIEELSFRYEEDCPPIENVENLSGNMHKYAPFDYITGESLIFEYNPEAISKCLDYVRMDNVNIMMLSKTYEDQNICDEVENWFSTKYKMKDIPAEWFQNWLNTSPESFALPNPNPFLASDFSLLEPPSNPETIPVRIDSPEDEFSLWYRQDSKFRVPKAILSFYLVTPLVTESPHSIVMLEFLAKLLKHQLMERVYDALVAQLDLSIHHYDRGLVIKVSGLNHKLHFLLNEIVDHLARFEDNVVADVFDALKDEQEKAYRNYCLKPSKLITDARLTILHTSYWSVIDRFHAVRELTLDSIKEFSLKLKETFRLNCLVQGNYSKEQALEVARNLKCKLQPKTGIKIDLPPIRICQVPQGKKYCRIASFHASDSNSVVTNYYQCGPTNIRQSSTMEILTTLMDEPVFDVLRTREQLGYNVYVTLRNTFGVLGFSITVDFQADKFSGSHVDERIESFLCEFEANLGDITESELQTRVESLIKLKQLPDVSLEEEVSRNWNEILSEEYLFNRLEQEVHNLTRINLEEVRGFYQTHASDCSNSSRRKLSMQVIGRTEKKNVPCSNSDQRMNFEFLSSGSSNADDITDLKELRQTALIFPPLKSYNGIPEN